MKHNFTELVVQVIRPQYQLEWTDTHGVYHWGRVWENGVRLVAETGANAAVVRLFAILHDSKRLNEDCDREHGKRAAEFAISLRGTHIHLSDDEFDLLYAACAHHTDQYTHPDVTVQTCWDADRLDLGRVGIVPIPTVFAQKQPGQRQESGRPTNAALKSMYQRS